VSRGKKLDIFIGADFEEGWNEIETSPNTMLSSESTTPKQHLLHFAKEKRRGKTVTLVGPFSLKKEEQSRLLKLLKKKLGCGGAYKNCFMEFQGDLKEKLHSLLAEEGFRFKKGH
jgi:translation initiation factor 1